MLTLTVQITGREPADVEKALTQVLRSVQDGSTGESDNDDGNSRYEFAIEGVPESLTATGLLDFKNGTWIMSCSVHGELARSQDGNAKSHDRMVRAWADHERQEHGGTGHIDPSDLIEPIGQQ